MKKDSLVLGKTELACFDALIKFDSNAFLGYPEENGKEEEENLIYSFKNLVIDYLKLLAVSGSTIDEFLQRDIRYRKFLESLNNN